VSLPAGKSSDLPSDANHNGDIDHRLMADIDSGTDQTLVAPSVAQETTFRAGAPHAIETFYS
jgi:hypothetical protein